MTQLEPAWLTTIIETSDDAIVSKTLEGIVVSWNPGAERIFGYRADEIIGRPITVIFPPDRLGEEIEFLAAVGRGERIGHFETVRVRKDGRLIDVSVTLSPIRDVDGRILGVSKIARDVTTRKQAEALLTDRRRWLEGMLAALAGAVIAVDDKALISFMNPVAETLTGWAAAEAVGQSIDTVVRLVEESDRQPIENPTRQALRHGQKAAVAHGALLVSRTGAEWPVEARAAVIPAPDYRGGILGAIMALHDVTELRRASHVQSHFAAIVDSSDDAIVSKTLDGVVLSWNSAAERLFGYSQAEMKGRPITVIFPPDRLAEETSFLGQISRGERIEHYETVRTRKDGQPVEVSVSLSSIRGPNGRIVAVSKIARDITLQKRGERERVELLEREQAALRNSLAANRMKDEFIATLSHELRTPVNAILGWGQLLATGRLGPSETLQAIDVIVRNATLQAKLIDELLDLSAVVVGRVKLEVRPGDLAAVVQAAIESIRPSAVMKNLELHASIADDAMVVMGDAGRLQQVVWNLLTNALKFTPSGGQIDVRLERDRAFARLVVADTGVGIAPDVLPAIFDRFRQGDSSTTRRYGGLGLGLAIVRDLVELHGGSVWGESDGPGCGTRLTVELPLLQGHAHGIPAIARPTPSAAGDGPVLTGVRVLVVDDDKDACHLVGRLLSLAGATVCEAASATDALSAVQAAPFDCAVVDIGMPDVDGYGLMERWRGLQEAPPAVALTAFASEADRQRARQAGFQGHLAKPVVFEDLVRLIAEVARVPSNGDWPGAELSER